MKTTPIIYKIYKYECVFSSVLACYGYSARKSTWATAHSRGSLLRATAHTLSTCRWWYASSMRSTVCGWEPLANSCSLVWLQPCCRSSSPGCCDWYPEWRGLFKGFGFHLRTKFNNYTIKEALSAGWQRMDKPGKTGKKGVKHLSVRNVHTLHYRAKESKYPAVYR